MREINGARLRGVRGWLLLLCLLLLVWGPLELAVAASTAWSAIAVRGAPVALVLLLRLVTTAFGVAAGIALATSRGIGVPIAKTSLVLAAISDVIIYTTPYFPSNRPPGDTPIYLTAALTYDGLWLAYLYRSRRVRNTFH